MTERKRENFWPIKSNLGEGCLFWGEELGCIFPKDEMEGRKGCKGIVDPPCLFLKNGIRSENLTAEQILELKARVPKSPLSISPGNTKL